MGAIRVLAATLSLAALLSVPAIAQKSPPPPSVSHGLSMYGDLKYGPGFRHFDYVNPAAPKGGLVKLYYVGTFDNLNPFILKGVSAIGLFGANQVGVSGVFETLTVTSADEAFSEYGLLAESVELPADRSWGAYTLRAEARFHDGTPVTAEDVVWTFETLRTKGHPHYRSYYAKVASVEALGPRKIRFTFAPGDNRELALIVGQMPVLSR